MPRIREELLECVVYLYNTEERARAGAAEGVRGTGFLVTVRLENAPKEQPVQTQLYVVTAAHNIEKGATVIRLNRPDGATQVCSTGTVEWVSHAEGDDVTACPLHIDLGPHS